MRRQNSYYSSGIKEFLSQSSDEIFGVISSNSEHFQTQLNQANSWLSEIEILKNQLAKYSEGRIIFEYIIPRMGKRIDAVFLHKNIVFLLEFKCGDSEYKTSAIDQVYDYALDLKNFQKQSARKLLVPIVVSTKAPDLSFENTEEDRILAPIKCNENNIADAIDFVSSIYSEENFNYIDWENSEYFPTPTIVEAAQALYSGHNVEDITRNDAR